MPALGAVLLAFILRTVGVDSLHLWGDSAYSVFSANRSLAEIALDRLTDGHPPLYYYLLHFWVALAGNSELSVRFLSAVSGILTVLVTYQIGRRSFGLWSGVAAAFLVATSPFLVFYSRLPRMYSLLAFLAALSILSLLSFSNSRTWKIAYVASTVAMLYTHYFGVLAFAAAALTNLLILLYERRFRQAIYYVSCCVVILVSFLPWVLFSFVSSAGATSQIISNAPSPPNVLSLLIQLWTTLITGELLEVGRAQMLALLFTGLIALSVISGITFRRVPSSWTKDLALLMGVFLVSTLALLPVFIYFPYFVRPRFMIFLVPVLALIVGSILGVLLRRNRVFGYVALTGLIILQAITLVPTYRVERDTLEADAIQSSQVLYGFAGPADGLISHAFWQLGYLHSHIGSQAPKGYALRELKVEDAPALLEQHEKLWLAMYQIGPRHPNYPIEEWLDRNAARAKAVDMWPTRLNLYTLPAAWDEEKALVLRFEDGIELDGYKLTNDLKPGGVLGVELDWKTYSRPGRDYTVFMHLLDRTGSVVVGEDSTPVNGIELTSKWSEGLEVRDKRALLLPYWLSAGAYSLEIGLYRGDTGERLKITNSQTQEIDRVLIEGLAIQPLRETPHPPQKALSLSMADGIYVMGCDLIYRNWLKGEQANIQTPTGEWVVTKERPHPRPGDSLELLLYGELRRDPSGGEAAQDWPGPSFRLVRSGATDVPVQEWGPVAVTLPSSGPANAMFIQRIMLALDQEVTPGKYLLQLRTAEGIKDLDRFEVMH